MCERSHDTILVGPNVKTVSLLIVGFRYMAEGDDQQLFSSRTAIQSFVMMESSNQRLEKMFDVVQTGQCE
jgi:hypothetical protein